MPAGVARMSNALRVGLAGFVATAVAYGPARTGYYLFVPDFRGEFGLSTGAAGAIGSGLQAGFLLALVATVLLVGRLGPRLLVAAGGITASSACSWWPSPRTRRYSPPGFSWRG